MRNKQSSKTNVLPSTAEREIDGRIEELIAREFWLGDELVTRFCVVIIQTGQGNWKLYWDDDDEQWKLNPTKEEFCQPLENFEVDGQTWRYPHIDLATLHSVRGQPIASFTVKCGAKVDEASLELGNGKVLSWSYEHASEKTSLKIDCKTARLS